MKTNSITETFFKRSVGNLRHFHKTFTTASSLHFFCLFLFCCLLPESVGGTFTAPCNRPYLRSTAGTWNRFFRPLFHNVTNWERLFFSLLFFFPLASLSLLTLSHPLHYRKMESYLVGLRRKSEREWVRGSWEETAKEREVQRKGMGKKWR